MPRTPHRGLLAAALAPAALTLTLLTVPEAPWRIPLALVALLWSPGYAALALAYPPREGRLNGLERHALALALGLLLAPVAGLAASLLWGFRAVPVSAMVAALTLALAAAAHLRERRVPEGAAPDLGAFVPGTSATLAISAAALVVAAGVWAVPFLKDDPGTPAALALFGPDGTPASLPSRLAPGENSTVTLALAAGSAAREGRLTVDLVPVTEGEANRTRLLDLATRGPAGGEERAEVPLPGLPEGRYRLEARWTFEGGERLAHLSLLVEEEPE